MSLAEAFIRDILRNASALREAGVLRLTVEGCGSVELAPHQAEPDEKDEDEDEDGDPEHPAFNPKIRLREYSRGDGK